MSRREFLRLTAGVSACAAFRLGAASAPAREAPRAAFRLGYLSDTHLGAGGDRFLRAMRKAVDDLNAQDPRPEFVLFGGDLSAHGARAELELGKQVLAELRSPVRLVAGEHDVQSDQGEAWQRLFGPPSYGFDHAGVHFIALDTATFRVGEAQRAWLAKELAALPRSTPLVVFTHAPLFHYKPAWGFDVADADAVLALLQPFERVTVLHGHTQQLLCHRIGNIDFHGLLSTAWPLPYPPNEVPKLTVQMSRPEPFDPFDGCGDGQLLVRPSGAVDVIHNLWDRDPITVTARYLSSAGEVDRPPAPAEEAY